MTDLASSVQAQALASNAAAADVRGAEAVRVVQQATEAPGVFVFGELLDVPGIREDPQHASAFRMLYLFASGVWDDYARARAAYPELSAAQATKLRQLTILSLAHQKRSLPFAEMAQAVGIDTTHSTRKLEDLIVDSIYEGLFTGQLDARAGCFNVDAVTARDVVPPASGEQGDPIHTLHDALTAWYVQRVLALLTGRNTRAQDALRQIDAQVAHVQQEWSQNAERQRTQHDSMVRALSEARNARGFDEAPTQRSERLATRQRAQAGAEAAEASEDEPMMDDAETNSSDEPAAEPPTSAPLRRTKRSRPRSSG